MKVRVLLLKNNKSNKNFKIFYKFRFDKDYLKYNINKSKFSRKESKIWYNNNYKRRELFAIYSENKLAGLIIYNLDSFYYSITLIKSYRNKGIGKGALKIFIKYLKKKRKKLRTIINIDNYNSINLHKSICKYKKKVNKNFYYFKIL
jgi:RimJ/RimL family protein N-acetyltransferase